MKKFIGERNGIQIIEEGGFEFLRVESEKIRKYLDAYNKADPEITGINISRTMGYDLDDLDFLNELPSLRALYIQNEISDISPIFNLKELEFLILEDTREQIDFSVWKKLRDLRITWNSRHKNLNECIRLENLSLRKYNPKEKCLIKMHLPELKELTLITTRLESLEGIAGAGKLVNLELAKAPNLRDIVALEGVKKTLERIEITSCKKIESYEVLSKLTKLKKLILTKCGDIPSLSFMKNMKQLEFFSFVETNILDGDLSSVVNLPNIKYVGFFNKKHYSHTDKEVEKILEAK